MKKTMCPYRDSRPVRVTSIPHDTEVHRTSFWGGGFPIGIKRIWVKCPTCGRKLLSSVTTCHDECCAYHSIPWPHKRKAWWKKQGFHKKKSGRSKRARYVGCPRH